VALISHLCIATPIPAALDITQITSVIPSQTTTHSQISTSITVPISTTILSSSSTRTTTQTTSSLSDNQHAYGFSYQTPTQPEQSAYSNILAASNIQQQEEDEKRIFHTKIGVCVGLGCFFFLMSILLRWKVISARKRLQLKQEQIREAQRQRRAQFLAYRVHVQGQDDGQEGLGLPTYTQYPAPQIYNAQESRSVEDGDRLEAVVKLPQNIYQPEYSQPQSLRRAETVFDLPEFYGIDRRLPMNR